MADYGLSPVPANQSTFGGVDGSFGGLDDPFGLLATLSGAWPAGGIAAALAASGLARDAIFAPPGVYLDQVAPAAPVEPCAYDDCAQCGAQMSRGMNDLEYVCLGCGLIIEGDTVEPEDDAPRTAPITAQLRYVGKNGKQLQPDLHRSSTGNTMETQRKQIFEEYSSYRAYFIEAGGRALPFDACKLASLYYNEVQQQCVKRSQNKKSIMAACLYHACLQLGFSRDKSEIAAFMQLPNKGIARGANFVRALVADGKMEGVDINADPCRPEITSLFARLGLEGDAYSGLRDAVFDIVNTAIINNIGTSSFPRSKVAGATFVVLQRCKDRELIPKAPGIQEFCQGPLPLQKPQPLIRKNTVERFTRQLIEYHHCFFESCYVRAGLDASPPR